MLLTIDLNCRLFPIDFERSAFQYKSTMYSTIKSQYESFFGTNNNSDCRNMKTDFELWHIYSEVETFTRNSKQFL